MVAAPAWEHSNPQALPLDPSDAAREALAASAWALLEQMQERALHGPLYQPTPSALIESMLRPPGERERDAAALFEALRQAAACGWSKTGGGDLAFIPNGGLYSGAIAALLASGLHAFTGAAFEVPALVALEESVLRWMAELVGLPAQSEGILLSGGSLANQTAIVCAREDESYRAGRSIAYLSERVHHSLPKALHLCGIPRACVRSIAADGFGRIDTQALRSAIASDRAQGLEPWLIVGVAGSTDSGSIDALPLLADIAAEHGAWFHVDAAYGGFFALTARGQTRLAGIERADSVTLDAHKGLQLPYGVGALLVREAGALARAHSGAGAYMRDVPAVASLPHYFERGPELTRPFRGLLVWLPLHLHGLARFRAVLDRSLDLAAEASGRLGAMPGIEVDHAPELSIVVFRSHLGDASTQGILEAINGSGRFHVSSTHLHGRVAIRLAFLNHRSGKDELEGVLGIIGAASRA